MSNPFTVTIHNTNPDSPMQQYAMASGPYTFSSPVTAFKAYLNDKRYKGGKKWFVITNTNKLLIEAPNFSFTNEKGKATIFLDIPFDESYKALIALIKQKYPSNEVISDTVRIFDQAPVGFRNR